MYKQAMLKLLELNECTMPTYELKQIRESLSVNDERFENVTLKNIENLWYNFSADYMAQCLVVNEGTIEDFKIWLN